MERKEKWACSTEISQCYIWNQRSKNEGKWFVHALCWWESENKHKLPQVTPGMMLIRKLKSELILLTIFVYMVSGRMRYCDSLHALGCWICQHHGSRCGWRHKKDPEGSSRRSHRRSPPTRHTETLVPREDTYRIKFGKSPIHALCSGKFCRHFLV